MKVRCTRLLDWAGRPEESSVWLKVGGVYHVLGIWIELGQVRFRLVGEESTPALYQPEMFEILSGRIPRTWVASSPSPGCISLEPAAWSHAGFWEKYFDQDPEALATFEEECRKIIGEE